MNQYTYPYPKIKGFMLRKPWTELGLNYFQIYINSENPLLISKNDAMDLSMALKKDKIPFWKFWSSKKVIQIIDTDPYVLLIYASPGKITFHVLDEVLSEKPEMIFRVSTPLKITNKQADEIAELIDFEIQNPTIRP